MITEVKQKDCRFSIVYVYDTSRFARRQYHAQMYKHLLRKRNIELHFLKLPKADSILDGIIETLMEAFLKGRAQFVAHKALMQQLDLGAPYTTLLYCEDSALCYAGHTVWNRHNEMIDGKYIGGKKFRGHGEWAIKKNTHLHPF